VSESARAHTVQRMAHALQQNIGELLPPVAGAPDVVQRLQANANVLVRMGIDTPEKLQGFLTHCYRHDACIAAGALGLAGSLGYFAGITGSVEAALPALSPHFAQNPALLGLIVGMGTGALDAYIGALGSGMGERRIYNGTAGNGKLPRSVKDPARSAEGLLSNITRSVALNVAKNAPRVLVPFLLAADELRRAGASDGTVPRRLADRIDLIGLDGFGGLFSVGAGKALKLGQGVPYDARMLLRSDLERVVDKTRQSWQQAAADVAGGVGDGVRVAFTSTVPVAVTVTIGLFVTNMLTGNAQIDSSLSELASAARGQPIPADRADMVMLALKRLHSTAVAAALTGAVEVVVPLATQLDATLHHAAHAATQRVRDGLNTLPDLGEVWRALSRMAGPAAEPEPGPAPLV
jgi:hypothetical protein